MLYFHIGTQKTGSSSIQHMLHANDQILHQHSYHYLKSGRDDFRWWTFPKRRRIHHNPIAAALKSDATTELATRLAKEIGSCRHENMIVSGELLSQTGIAEGLSDLVPPRLSRSTRIIIYLRRPDLYLESLYKQRLKSNATSLTPSGFLAKNLKGLMHLSALKQYAAAFGKENIILRPYQKDALVNRDVVDDFLDTIGFPASSDIVRPAQDANISFSVAFSELSGLAVKHLGLDAPTITKAVQRENPPGIYRSQDVFTLKQRRMILDRHADGIETVRRMFRPDLGELFNCDDLAAAGPDPYPTKGEQVELMKDAAAAFIRTLPRLPRRKLVTRSGDQI